MNKKIIKYFIFIFILIIFLTPHVFALNYENICSDSEGVMKAFKIISYVIQIIRWIVPIMIIVFGMIDFSKAIISDDENAGSKATNALIRRLIAGVVVFFIPTIVLAILNAIEITHGIENSTPFEACTKCIFNINECK